MAESIIKDSFYKERLLQSSFNTHSENMDEIEEDSAPDIPQEVLKAGLTNFGKTASGSGYAFRDFKCSCARLQSFKSLTPFIHLQNLDISHNNIRSLNVLTHLRYLKTLNASYNNLTKLLDVKHVPFGLVEVDCSNNEIEAIPNLEKHRFLRKLNLRKNKISKIEGLKMNKNLQILDLSENEIEDIEGLNDLNITELYLSANRIALIKGLSKLDKLRVLDLSLNQISRLSELLALISLRTLVLSKNNIKHVREINFLENLAYLSQLDLCFNPVQERRYYRLQILYKLPMLKTLDGSEVTSQELVKAENLYGVDVEERHNIFKNILPEEDFIDRRIHVSQLIEPESDSGGEDVGFVDKYDQEGRLKSSSVSKQGYNRSHAASKRTNFSKVSKMSKLSKISAIN